MRQLSRMWGASERTLWRKLAEFRARRGAGEASTTSQGGRGPGKRPGPRPPSLEEQAAAEAMIHAVLEKLGWKTGESTVFNELAGVCGLRLVRRILARLKAARARRIEAAKVARRFSFQALAGGVMWCLDEAQLAAKRRPKAPVFIQLIRDPATRQTSASAPSPPATGEAAIGWVEQQIETMGMRPLVISTDNGGAFTSDDFEDFLAEQQIIHLKNLPHTPEHNTHAERGVMELKRELEIPKGAQRQLQFPSAPEGLGAHVIGACSYLNEALVRGVLGGLTAIAAAARLPVAETLVDRSEFFAETRSALADAVQGCTRARARRLAERKAIFETLARFNLITITRGGKDAADLNTDKSR